MGWVIEPNARKIHGRSNVENLQLLCQEATIFMPTNFYASKLKIKFHAPRSFEPQKKGRRLGV